LIFTLFPHWLIPLGATFFFQGNRIVAHPYINRSALFMQVPVASLLRRPVNIAHSVLLAATPNMGSFLTRPVRSINAKSPVGLALYVYAARSHLRAENQS